MTGAMFRFCGTMVSIPLAAWLFPGVWAESYTTAWIAGVLLAFVFLLLRPLVKLLLSPFNCLTFGLVGLLADVGLVYLIAEWMPGIHINGFAWIAATAVLVMLLREGLGRLAGGAGRA